MDTCILYRRINIVDLSQYFLSLIVIGFVFYFIGRRAGKRKALDEIGISVSVESEYGDLYSAAYDEEDDDRDAYEGAFYEASDPKKVSAHLQIEYTDGKGKDSARLVRVREYDDGLYGGVILGLCELRNANRTFRYDRIRSCTDVDTGEVVSDVKTYLNQIYEASPERSTDILASDYIDVLKVLFYMAKADGQFRKEEKVVIANYVGGLVRDERITPALVTAVTSELGGLSLQAFKLAFGRVLKSGQADPVGLQKCCQDIVDTQKKVHPSEQEALDYLTKKLAG